MLQDSGLNYSEHRYSSDDGLSLYYRQYGRGNHVVVCLPGLSRNSKDFHELASRLATNYRLICPDLRGRGQSDYDPNWRRYDPATYALDTWKLLDELKVREFVIIGTSLGGLVAMVMSSQQSERISAVVMNDIGPETDPVGQARILGYAGKRANVTNWENAVARCKLINEQAIPAMPDDFWNQFARNTYRENNQGIPHLDMDPNVGVALRYGARLAGVLTKIRKTGLLKRYAGVFIDPWDSFRCMDMPVLVLRGETSDILSQEVVERMQTLKPHINTALIPNRGHAPTLDEPASIHAIDNFLAGLS